MTTHDNGPRHPDWLPESPRCANPDCACRATYCQFLATTAGRTCCDQCSHDPARIQLRMPALYEGDQA